MDMRRALKDRLVAYKIPQEMKVLDAIPRNAMGKGKLMDSFFTSSFKFRRESLFAGPPFTPPLHFPFEGTSVDKARLFG